MEGFFVFIDAPKPGADPQALATALAIDAYRARMLGVSGAPFLARGFATRDAATRAAAMLDAAGFPSTAHEGASFDAVPAPLEAESFSTTATTVILSIAGGERVAIEPASVRALILGKIQVKIQCATHAPSRPRAFRGGLAGIAAAALEVPEAASQTERALTYQRLEIFADASGPPVRIGIRQDRFDFAQLHARKTLSSARNLEILKDALAHASEGATVDLAFHRSEMSRGALAADVWIDFDLGAGSPREVAARSNREAFDVYARARHLHETARRRAAQDHYYEF